MECVPGELFYCDFPFSDACEFKDRPVLIVAKVFKDDAIVCMVTSKKAHFDDCIELHNADLTDGRLESNPSYIRPTRLFTTNPKLFRRKAGQVNETILNTVLNCLSKRFSPS